MKLDASQTTPKYPKTLVQRQQSECSGQHKVQPVDGRLAVQQNDAAEEVQHDGQQPVAGAAAGIQVLSTGI